ncbi:dTDP-4-dehydrorhamnose 3,5-epimerase [Paraliomyxa miuraensis]|uniref:dTDP-4-dehydrorhamnose 3,5-epimerase n=1 Tax=Paraliomyxa miuraensis TaxID=376150 RepID=UPI002254ECE8|nr:dTDP-4-dehydrorhamnose 3,5-epimerase [Paraliomyxa miuraensis]MCX4241003.1 dTDP-4-dehydrorhamnose 3,5-epimerase [Paraliomyxa miuraensis]
MKVTRTKLKGVLLIEPDVFEDPRGFFLETWSLRRFSDAGLPQTYVQDNLSRSSKGILRGLHLQHPHGQGKLVQVMVGEVFDVAVDVRVGSPTFGQWEGIVLSGDNHRQLYIPPGFAHGFCVTSEHALFSYKCTELYHRETELGVAWNDPELAIEWPVTEPQLSAKDARFPRLAELPVERLPRWE